MKLLNGKSLNSGYRSGALRRSASRRFPAVRLALLVVLVAAAAGGLTSSGQAYGFGGHNWIIEMSYGALDKQAYSQLASMLATYWHARDGGSVFPDWAYAAKSKLGGGPIYDQYAEVAHRPGFVTAFFEYIKPIFKKASRTDDENQTITFLFGLISHLEADNPSHFGSGGETAFLTMAEQQDGAEAMTRLACSAILGNNLHSCTEFGVDVIILTHSDEGYHGHEWFFPMNAVQSAYRALGIGIPVADFQAGLEQLQFAYQWEKNIAWLDTYENMDWAHANLYSYHPGGLNDATSHTVTAWQSAWNRLSAVTYTLYVPGIQRGTAGLPASGQQPPDESGWLANHGSQYTYLAAFGQKLVDEGVIKMHSRWENGNLIVGDVEILDQQRYDQILQQMVGEQNISRSR